VLKDKVGILNIRVFVVTGKSKLASPTQEVADLYGEELGLEFEMVPDLLENPTRGFPPWASYRKYIGNSLTLPAAVILSKEGKVLQTFYPGTFGPEQVIHYIEDNLS